MKFFPEYRDEGETIATFGDARLIKFLDGKLELKGGSKEDRLAAHEWISMFMQGGSESGGQLDFLIPTPLN